ncbi:MAG: AzlC family ABC transporter permease [Lachnospiraceae bacterium]|nr:AzlC family ABC transporter permease [Lachnospiraceae bacterium]
MKKKALKAAFPHTIPIMAGYIVLEIGFGILLKTNGYSFLWAFAMSVFIYAGSMQYVAVTILTQGVSLINTAIISLMLQARHLFYGLSMIEKYNRAGKKKFLIIHELTDETFSLTSSLKAPNDVDESWFFFFISILNHLYWIIGCCAGAILGSFIPFSTKGIDFAMTALFVVIFTEQWMDSQNHIPALIGLLGSLACLLIFGADRFIIPSMIVILALLTVSRKKLEKEADSHDTL